MGLLEVMVKFSDIFFENYSVDICKYMTLPSLALAVFGSNFYVQLKTPIKGVGGDVEMIIRESYYGGNSQNFGGKQIIKDAWYVDMNSQYPASMKNKMPTGDPVFSTNTNLNDYFGIVYADITPPSEEDLPNLFIQNRDLDGHVTCPRTQFTRWIVYGYKAKIQGGINFPDHCEAEELFGEYIDHFFEMKATATDGVRRSIAKLMLNSLYGKFGQKTEFNNINLLDEEAAFAILDKYNYTMFAEVAHDKFLVKYGKEINSSLKRFYKNENKEIENNFSVSTKKGVCSAPHKSSMISAFARMSINTVVQWHSNFF